MDAWMAANGEEELSLPRTATEWMVALVDLVISNMDGVDLLNKVANDQRPTVHHAHVLMSSRLRLL
jgi:CheY-like chemotaxis protein